MTFKHTAAQSQLAESGFARSRGETMKLAFEKETAFWNEQFDADQLPTVLPYRYASTDAPVHMDSLVDTLTADVSNRITQLAKGSHLATYMILLTGVQCMLHKYTSEQTIMVGMPIVRKPTETRRPINNVVLLSHNINANDSFKTLLTALKTSLTETISHQNIPFRKMTERLQLQHVNGVPVVNTIVSLSNLHTVDMGQSVATELHLQFECKPSQEIGIRVSFDANRYDNRLIAQFVNHLNQLFAVMLFQPELELGRMNILSESEQHQLLHQFNDTSIPYPREKTIHQLFEEQTERTPDAVAVVFEDKQLTYAQLNRAANRLAVRLNEQGVGLGSLVGICVERSFEMVIGLLAIVKAGGVYVPIDPSYPQARITAMLEDTKVNVLLTQAHLQQQLELQLNESSGQHLTYLILNDASASEATFDTNLSADGPESVAPMTSGTHTQEMTGDEGAYIVYTSGSTGTPKGVCVPHRGVVRLVTSPTYVNICEQDVFLQGSTISFDAATFEIWGSLLNGATLVILPPGNLSLAEWASAIQQHGVTVLWLTAGLFQVMVENQLDQLQGVKQLLVGGDVVSKTHAQKVLARYRELRLINGYGPSENTTFTCCHDITMADVEERGATSSIPIGRPIGNTQVYVLDNEQQLLPIGVVGELYAGGDGLAQGYLNRPDLTAEKFVDHPFVQGQKLYRTGDLAKWLPDGTIEFVGRMDDQVKIRGYRIELGEIEASLLKIEAIQAAIVVVSATHTGEKQLCAYYVANQTVPTAQLRDELSHQLPAYMMPSYFVQLEQLPLTSNGKIDRKALPAPEELAQAGIEYVAPRTPLETQLATLWQEVLGLEKVSVKDNFFDIGGHSLRASTLVSKLHKELGYSLSLREVFQYATLEAMAEQLAGATQHHYEAIPIVEEQDYYPVSSAQKRLYVLHQLEGAEQSYNMPGVMQLEGQIDKERFEYAFQALIARHETLRTGFELVNGEPMQRIYRNVDFAVEYIQASATEADEQVHRFIRTFHLEQPPLLRVGLIELTEQAADRAASNTGEVDTAVQRDAQRYILMFDMHHIISDGTSMGILVEEFVRLYSREDLAPLRIQYKDYAVWQQSQAQQEQLAHNEAYWLKALGGTLPILEMPTDYARPAVQSYTGDTFKFVIDANKSEQLRRLATESSTTLYMVLLAAYTILLQKYTGQDDIIVGTPLAGRTHSDVQPLIGMFINTLAIRNYPTTEKAFRAYLEDVKEATLGAFEHQNYPFEQLVEKLQVTRDLSRNPLFDTMFALQNTDSKDFQLDELYMQPYSVDYNVSKFDLSLDVAEGSEGLECSFEFATALYKRDTVIRMAEHFDQLIAAIVNEPEAKLAALSMLTEEETAQIQYVFNDPTADYTRDKTVHQLFEEQVERTPNQTAVVFAGEQLTYEQLNDRANRLARTLRVHGVQPDQLVGIMAERSLDMIVGIIAILKAGGAYVPIDPQYPEDRIVYMLENSKAQVLLTQQHLQARVPFDGTWIFIDDEAAYHEDGSNVEALSQPDHLSYVIYTSGTTGQPKGVMIEHRQLTAMASAWKQEYELQQANQSGVRWLQWASFSFDVFTGDMARALLFGGELILCPEETRINPEQLVKLIQQHRIQMFESTPALVIPLMDTVFKQNLDISSLELLIVGSDQCPTKDFQTLVTRFGSQMRIVNSYGVTEACIDASYFELSATERDSLGTGTGVGAGAGNGSATGSGNANATGTESANHVQPLRSLPIGKPLPAVTMYVLDEHFKFQPIGIAGELFIGGAAVGRGYWLQPELTADKFVDNPFVPGERMYRTGDLAKWLPDGNIEFLGRIDHQVKIRGNRIEIGEVETQLLKVAAVREAVVVAREHAGLKVLCAYYTADNELTVNELREAMAQQLPGYMIPSYFIQLEKLPLTPNGKVDRKGLPAPEGSVHTGTAYVAPRTEVEKLVADVWQAVLGGERIGVMDHFFELGGDSIKSIQVSSRLHQAGYKLEIRDLFKYPTVAQLSLHIQPVARIADQGAVHGSVPLSPIQHWFFAQQFADPHHYNQSVMLYRKEGFAVTAMHSVLQKMVEHHDALRIVFQATEQGVTGWNRSVTEGELYGLEVVDLRGVAEAECGPAVAARANDIQRSMQLQTGPLVKVGLFQCADGDHLLLVIHHGVVDGVSWRILLEDIAAGYEQALNGADIRLPLKTDAYRTWSEQLAAYTQSAAMEQERAYWQGIAQVASDHVQPLPKDEQVAHSLQLHSDSVIVQWNEQETEQLLKQVHRAYNTEMDDILLTALGMAVQQWSGNEHVLVNLESHGRESIMADIDISRTVGWFTSEYPVLLDVASGQDLSYRIKKVKEDLRQIPSKGVGYGVYRYLTPHVNDADPEQVGNGARAVTPEISFNYLGQFDQDLQQNELDVSPYSSGSDLSEQQHRQYTLDINGMISDGSLTLDLSYSTQEYRKETIEQLAQYLQQSLQDIIAHCTAKSRPELTPSDVLLKGLSVAELNRIAEQTRHLGELENMYMLTPMQKGMWFHSTMDRQSGAYFEQTRFTIVGEFNVELFANSLNMLAKRHAVLRTNFYSDWKEELIQIVYRDKPLGFMYQDLQTLTQDEQQLHLANLVQEDRARGFDLEQDALMRVAVIRTEAERYHVLWSSHHILMDGWCMPQLIKELFETYAEWVAAQAQGSQGQLPNATDRSFVPTYSQYIEWLDRQDEQAAADYWGSYLAGYDQQTVLPQAKTQQKTEEYAIGQVICELGNSLSGQLSRVAKQHQVTLNTLMQAVWGIMLQKYNGTDDVVFGGVVSGRPAEIPGIEEMVGLFINTIPIRVATTAEASFADVMGKLQEQALESGRYDYYPLYSVQALTSQKQQLLNHIMVFENYPMEEQIEQAGGNDSGELAIADVTVAEQTNFDFNLMVVPGDNIVIRFDFNTHVFERASIERLKGHLIHVLEQVVANPHKTVGQLALITAEETVELLDVFNDTAVPYPHTKTIHRMFEEQVERTPHAVAVTYDNQQLTYTQLNERANRLARTLRAAHVEPNQLVAITVERSLEMMVGIMAILKAGGAYVPIDPNFPGERIRFILEDSEAKVLLTQGHLLESIQQHVLMDEQPFAGRIVNLDDHTVYDADGSNIESVNDAKDAAYVIYTSGTTGKPKGVLVEHHSVINRLIWMHKSYPIDEHDTIMQKTAITFDVSVWELFWWAFVGSKVCLLPVGGEKNPAVIADTIAEQRITTMHFVPSMLHAFLEYVETQATPELQVQLQTKLSSLRQVFASGEALTLSQVERFQRLVAPVSGARLINLYGPTEATVDVSYFNCEPGQVYTSVPIGKPIDNTQLYIVSRHNQLQPIGVAGELCIAGVGLARGYVNRPELTAEKFVTIPFSGPFAASERMYRTGDLARWMPDGNIEYLGRFDHQVKIRGYRIELGEIEAQLLKVSTVRDSVVVARDDDSGQKVLCAYFVADSELTVNQLREELAQDLPSYMIPSYFVQLEQLPLSANGKIDRKALPAPEGSMHSDTEYVAPRTEVEATLAAVWQAVLGVQRVGVRDHFFELGGDSIKSIQIASRLHQAGYKLEIRDLFKYPTIAQLSPHLQPAGKIADQGEVAGEVALTPIQHWYFEQQFTDAHYFNQSVMLFRPDRFDETALRQTVQSIVVHHDALRTVFRQTEQGTYTAWNRGVEDGSLYSLEVVDLKGTEATACEQAIEHKANELQSQFDLQAGPLVRVGLFQCADGDHLLIIVHHGVIDGISWRILLEDLADGYEQALRGKDIRLPLKTDAYQLWAEQLTKYAHSPAMEQEQAYWQRIAQLETKPLPKDKLSELSAAEFTGGADQDSVNTASLQRDSESVVVQCSKEETEQLLKQVHRAYNTEMDDILLTALGLAVQQWSGHERILVHLEGHGRESILPNVDITRTIGWFTSLYPVILEMERDNSLSYQIKKTKEDLRQIPNKGIGYGIFRYLSQVDQAYADVACSVDGQAVRHEPEIRFNYLGQFDQDLQNNELAVSPFSSGSDVSDNQQLPYILDINGMIAEGSLSLDLSYSGKQYRRETMEELAGLFLANLQDIIAHCTTKERPEATPSDVLLAGLSVEELEQIADQTQHIGEIENMYTLTPMQKGMWFHSALDRHTGAYFEQTRFMLQGVLDVDLFVKSLQELAKSHAILRTNFYSGWKEELLQIVYRNKSIGFAFEDVRHLAGAESSAYVDELIQADKDRGFDLERDALMRVTVVRLEDASYQVIWSSHHILMDGWCLPQLTQQLFAAYSAFVQQEQPDQSLVPSYSEYIEWLGKQDEQAAAAYWSGYLADYDQQTVLPLGKAQGKSDSYVAEHVVCDLSKSLSGRLSRVAKQHQVTLNTLLQAAWGIILQKYNGTSDAVFGSVVSGRPAEIGGIEEMIGLFINTIPVRVACTAETSFADVMEQLQEQALESGKYDYYPLYEIQARSAQKQDLLNHIMVFENYPMEAQIEQAGAGAGDGDGSELMIADVIVAEQTNYDFNLIIIPGEELIIRFDYNGQQYERASLERLAAHVVNVLEQIVSNPRIAVGELELATAVEQEQMVHAFNDTVVPYPREKTIHQLFEEQVARTPDAVAVKFASEQLTYAQLNDAANKLASSLQQTGVGVGSLVGICAERSLEMITGLLAILKAGGAYVPIDPSYPQERIVAMLEDTQVKVLLTQQHLQADLQSYVQSLAGVQVVLLDAAAQDDVIGEMSSRASVPQMNGDDLAYIVYTSGSTGVPKGVCVTHRGVVRLVKSTNYVDIREQDVCLQGSTISFDAATFEIWGSLLNGAALTILPSGNVSLAEWADTIQQHGVTILWLTAGLFQVMVEHQLQGLQGVKQLLVGGDVVSKWHAKKVLEQFSGIRLINGYGPTENTTFTCCHDIKVEDLAAAAIPIGRPINNTQVYVLDGAKKPLPIGVVGELYTGGDGLARGYLNRPDLTAEKFVDHPFKQGERLYRTGDLARWLPDGSIDYVGRIDDQVKIRGYRIELGEVETHLLNVEAVQEALVVARSSATGDKQLCAYYVADRLLSASELRSSLAQELPAYMLPSYYVQLETMPLTPNGKVDRRALPAPEEHVQTGADYVAPRTPLEQQLARIWQAVLGLDQDQVGVHDNFFELGGHSLRATTLVSKLHKEENINLSLRDVFRYPTLEAMAQHIEAAAADGTEQTEYVSIPLVEERDVYPVSSAQKRMYILQQLDGAAESYNMPGVVMLEGPLDRARFEAAFRGLIERHETLRTGFELVNGEPVQRVHMHVPFAVQYIQASEISEANEVSDASQASKADQASADSEEATAETIRQFVRAFQLDQPPLLRVGLVELAPERHMLMFDMHHIVSDGTSMGILVNEFVHLYGGEQLEPLRIQYKDFAVWQQSDAQKIQLQAQEAYWLNALGGQLPILEMPTDYVRPAVQSFEGSFIQFVLNAEKSEALRRIAADSGATVYMVLLAAYTALLHKYTGQEDIIVGTPIAGRTHENVQPLIGMFVNTLAIRSYPAGHKSFQAYLEEVKETTLGAYENQNYPFEELVDNVQVTRDMSRNPVFDTMFILQNTEQGDMSIDGLHFKNVASEHTVSKFDMTFQVAEEDAEMICSIEYATGLYKQATIERMAGHFEQLVDAIIADQHISLATLHLLTAQEQVQIRDQFNATAAPYAREQTIHELFEAQVERTPDTTAVWFGAEQLTYAQLNAKANQLAAVLRSKGVTAEQPVGIMIERSIELVVAVLAVLKSSGTFVPIDPEYPDTRIRYMLDSSGAKLVLTEPQWFSVIPDEVDKVDIHQASLFTGASANVPNWNDPSHLLYIIYTSGTTGNPKGVMLEHRNMVNLLQFQFAGTSIPFPASILQYASNSFDVCYQEMFSALLYGGCLHMINNEVRKDPQQLFACIKQHHIEVLYLPVAFLKFIFTEADWVEQFPSCVRHIITAGEQLVVTPQAEQCLQRLQISLHNHYGPSETHVVTTFTMKPDEIVAGLPPIGKPIANTSLYIVDDNFQMQPIGVSGELYVAGDCVGRGYWGRPDLTAEKFVDNPFVPGERMYKTGDLARWLHDGNVEYVGRIDHQVKIRGFRIELGEVESQLLKLEAVQEAVVIARDDEAGQKQLCAYFVAERSLSASELRGALARELPGYMIPAYYVQLERIPLTPNGKVDRNALPQPEGNVMTGAEFVAPRTAVEAQLAQIWQDVLGLPNVGVKDNFFDLGGHSLRATTLVSKLYKGMNINLPLRDVFRFPTIEEMATAIAGMEQQHYTAIPLAAQQDNYVLSSAQKRLYMLNELDGAELSYNMPVVMNLNGALDRERFEAAFRALIARHEALRTGFHLVDGEPMQHIYASVPFTVEYSQASAEAAEEIVQRFVRPFQLEQAPLLRVGLIELAGEHERYILMFDMHHIISDGASISILVEEFGRLYAGETLAPLQIQYKDYAEWQQSNVLGEQMNRQEAYWLQQMAGQLPVVDLPTDYDRPEVRSFDGALLEFEVDAVTTERLNQLASKQESTLYMVLLSAYTVLLSKYSGQEDIIVGTPVAGRAHADVEPLIGMFVNTLAIRNYPAGDKSYLSYLAEVKETTLGAFEHQDYPFEELVERLQVKRDASRNPVFDTMFVLQNIEDRAVQFDELTLSPYVSDHEIDAKFDLTLFVSEDDGAIKGGMQYCTKLFKPAMILKMQKDFLLVLSQICDNSELQLSQLKFNEHTASAPNNLDTIEFSF
ncbi:non-ribosomal peptide synthase/polyketide synthase [Paenibacillus sp. 481]|uniref:non-ribosomal peptide synthase/polyketide synthase n=1 Tax=Paenibacillus sp. 481 TaxID=2835869 RepID=UPI001E612195|nr:non-ribosomal peptide synthetase [Paenibacillus sp. 481]UHA73547.1 non-ribosomal peptide synthase/polyketide synthase [Paenibacillus sp. 481]